MHAGLSLLASLEKQIIGETTEQQIIEVIEAPYPCSEDQRCGVVGEYDAMLHCERTCEHNERYC